MCQNALDLIGRSQNITEISLQAILGASKIWNLTPRKREDLPSPKGKRENRKATGVGLFSKIGPRIHSLISRPPAHTHACTKQKRKRLPGWGVLANSLPQPPIFHTSVDVFHVEERVRCLLIEFGLRILQCVPGF